MGIHNRLCGNQDPFSDDCFGVIGDHGKTLATSTSFVLKFGLFFVTLVFFSFLYFFYCCSSTVVSIFLPPLFPSPPTPTSYPQSFPSLTLSMSPLYMILMTPFPLFLLSALPSNYCQFFLYFNVFIFCLFVLLIRFHL